jgi:hypothetical protein
LDDCSLCFFIKVNGFQEFSVQLNIKKRGELFHFAYF